MDSVEVMSGEGSMLADAAQASSSDMIEEAIERESWIPPVGDRWAIAAPGVDLSGKWKVIITDQFRKDYDAFLESLGESCSSWKRFSSA